MIREKSANGAQTPVGLVDPVDERIAENLQVLPRLAAQHLFHKPLPCTTGLLSERLVVYSWEWFRASKFKIPLRRFW